MKKIQLLNGKICLFIFAIKYDSYSGNDSENSINRSVTTTEQTYVIYFMDKKVCIFFSTEIESSTPSISKAERDQEIQKYYRADLIQHLTDWPATQLEKQV